MRFIKNLNLDDQEGIVSGPEGTKDLIIDRKSILNFGDVLKTKESDMPNPLQTISQPTYDDSFVTIQA